MAVEGVLPGLGFVEALIRSGHDLLKDVVDGSAAAVGGNTHVAVATATTIDISILGGQMSATLNAKRKKRGKNSLSRPIVRGLKYWYPYFLISYNIGTEEKIYGGVWSK